jgi:hypothetical protein
MEFRLVDEYFDLMDPYWRAILLLRFQRTICIEERLHTVHESIIAASHTLPSLSPERPQISFLPRYLWLILE